MFTSRAEHRLLLREDNADERLTPKGRALGLIDDRRWSAWNRKRDAVAAERARLGSIVVRPADLHEAAQTAGGAWEGIELAREQRALELLRRPGVTHASLTALPAVGPRTAGEGSIRSRRTDRRAARDRGPLRGLRPPPVEEIERARRHDDAPLPADLDYAEVHGLSHELRQKLGVVRPVTIGQASRIAGMTPAAVSLLLVHLRSAGCSA